MCLCDYSLFFFFHKRKMKLNLKTDKGVAGLSILLSVIVMLFIIGLIVMIFTLMSSEMQDATWTSTTATVTGEAVDNAYFTNGTGYSLAGTSRNAGTYTIVALYNDTTDLITSGNYTLTGIILTNATDFVGADIKVNYTYVYDAGNTGTDAINDTSQALAGVTDWFDIFIVITAMVVLILLTVIIITAIRSSGMIAGGQTGGNQVGTA